MKYEKLYVDFINMFPEDIKFFENRKKDTGADEDDGMHVVFGMIIVPYIRKIVIESVEKARKAFDFFEQMETSEDTRIAEVLEFSVLENILSDDKELLNIYAKYYGKETKLAVDSLNKWIE